MTCNGKQLIFYYPLSIYTDNAYITIVENHRSVINMAKEHRYLIAYMDAKDGDLKQKHCASKDLHEFLEKLMGKGHHIISAMYFET